MSKQQTIQQAEKRNVCSLKIADYLLSEGFVRRDDFSFEKDFPNFYVGLFITSDEANVTIGTEGNVWFPYQWVLANNAMLVKRLIKEAVTLALHKIKKQPISL